MNKRFSFLQKTGPPYNAENIQKYFLYNFWIYNYNYYHLVIIIKTSRNYTKNISVYFLHYRGVQFFAKNCTFYSYRKCTEIIQNLYRKYTENIQEYFLYNFCILSGSFFIERIYLQWSYDTKEMSHNLRNNYVKLHN